MRREDEPATRIVMIACAAFAGFSGTPLEKRYPAAVAVQERSWPGSSRSGTPGPRCRKVPYMSNAPGLSTRKCGKF
jgi:hypothetical protein